MTMLSIPLLIIGFSTIVIGLLLAMGHRPQAKAQETNQRYPEEVPAGEFVIAPLLIVGGVIASIIAIILGSL